MEWVSFETLIVERVRNISVYFIPSYFSPLFPQHTHNKLYKRTWDVCAEKLMSGFTLPPCNNLSSLEITPFF